MNQSNNRVKIGIIGAGPAGLSAAYQLTKIGYEVQVFEASGEVGGMSKSIELWGHIVDLGPHRFFSNDPKINAVWLELVKEDYKLVNRLTRIYYKGIFFHYPLKPFETLWKLGIFQGILCVSSFIKQLIFPIKRDGSFENWVIGKFGNRLYQIFFKTYSEKLWGISGKKLDEDFAAQRIKKFDFFAAIKARFGVRKKVEHQTLADVFAYPIEGTGMLYNRMAAFIIEHGGKIHLKQAVNRIGFIEDEKIQLECGNQQNMVFDKIISSMPLTHLVSILPKVPVAIQDLTKQLRFRNTILVYIKIKESHLFPDNWIYIHDSNVKTGRITNFSNWVPELKKDSDFTILCLEYWANNEDKIWTDNEDELVLLAQRELIKMGIVKAQSILDGCTIKIPRCYPIYDIGYKKKLTQIEEYLSGIQQLSVIGRYGAFKYNNQDHSILMGILAAENIAFGKSHDLWKVNTDYDVYQENANVMASGLLRNEVKGEVIE